MVRRIEGWSGSRDRGRSRAIVALAALAALAATGLTGCEDGPAMGAGPTSGLYYGEPVEVGEGVARTYVRIEGGQPVELGIALGESAFLALPDDHGSGGMTMPDGHKMYEYALTLPVENPTPYEHATLDWNPGGHMPPGIYDVPHFDFHFYTITDDERPAIDPADAEFQSKAERYPEAEFVPEGYVAPAPDGFPFMGVHWVDPTSPELNGETFTKTFLYGTWDGGLIFAEPMITKAYLETKPDVEEPIAVPQRYAAPGYYPTSYRVRWDEEAKEYRVALTGFVERD